MYGNQSMNNTVVELEQQQTLKQLDAIKSIDVTKALRVMSGQTKLYLKLSRDFTWQHQQRSQELKQLFDCADWNSLRHRVHSLKSFAAYVGAYALADASGEMEEQLSRAKFHHNQLTIICDQLDLIIAPLTAVFPLEEQPQQDGPFNEHTFINGLNTLLPLLQQSDFAAEQQLLSLKAMSKGTQYELAIVTAISLVDDLEFEQAIDDVLQLLQKLT
jgi:HPt (histidine-containing phosphotransfer) domain-containing protein